MKRYTEPSAAVETYQTIAPPAAIALTLEILSRSIPDRHSGEHRNTAKQRVPTTSIPTANLSKSFGSTPRTSELYNHGRQRADRIARWDKPDRHGGSARPQPYPGDCIVQIYLHSIAVSSGPAPSSGIREISWIEEPRRVEIPKATFWKEFAFSYSLQDKETFRQNGKLDGSTSRPR